jgi:putative lipoic acid-binding regulatory protein
VNILSKDDRAKIEYPCKWSYRVIVANEIEIYEVLFDITNDEKCEVKKTNSSKKGKYQSYNVEVDVVSKEHSDKLFGKLKSHKDVKMVL